MPWTGSTFKSRHNKKLSSSQAAKASRIANAVLKETGDEGKAIRIANSKAKSTASRSPMRRKKG